jgi:farnesyl diphosphate synthase
MLDYNVPGGKCNRGLSVVDSYKLLKGTNVLSQEDMFLASTLGWCVEWLQAYFLVLDDIMDDSHTRRGQPCWFRVPQVGSIAINDGIILRNHITRMLRLHFRGKLYYADLLDLFNEVEFKTASGQLLDLITTHEGEKDLNKYNIGVHRRIVQYKTSYYSFYLPVACALLLSGEDLTKYGAVEDILVKMGIYFQVQDDYLDCYGDPKFIGKIGTDIEDYKCSWLVVQALERADESQKSVLFENYGKKDPACVAKVKSLYRELNLEVCLDSICFICFFMGFTLLSKESYSLVNYDFYSGCSCFVLSWPTCLVALPSLNFDISNHYIEFITKSDILFITSFLGGLSGL